jgi:hypothetical protein
VLDSRVNRASVEELLSLLALFAFGYFVLVEQRVLRIEELLKLFVEEVMQGSVVEGKHRNHV